ncbi:hypothetical protein N9R84_02115 [Candidatus Pelagibacter sp.]|jgi:hypothetical protein|nr:hypothetical protein [Flavobacteriaceae bacterium]MDA9596576.1 hypothetical protein [Candidatus Pelagibacter sp.]
MIPEKVKDYLEEYVNQEVYVQISIIKGKEKVSTKSAINKYFNSNHFRDLSEGKPYDHFIDGLRDKCLGKLKDSPMRDKKTNDEIIKELQIKLNNLGDKELDNTFWEIETGEFLNGDQLKELEKNKEALIDKLDISKINQKVDTVYETILTFCKNYEELCQKKYPDAPLPLEVLKSIN